jgi:Fe-S cluster biogenesis protein NfuA
MSKGLHERIVRIESLIEQMKSAADPETRAASLELVQTMMEFHNVGIDRMMEIIANNEEGGGTILNAFTHDDIVSTVLLLHDLHPIDLETRVVDALETVRPYLRSHGGNVELVEVEDRIVRLKLVGNCNSCPSSELTMKSAIERAIHDAAPDVVAIETT